MDRRRFLVTSLAGALAPPLAARAQQADKVYRIGYLSGNPRSDTQQAMDAFRRRLHDLGYVEGQNLRVEYRHADAQYERLPQLAAELVHLKVDAIFAFSTPGARAAKNATGSIPIVFGVVSDPIAAGLVKSLARPGSNVTRVTPDNPDLSAKRVSLLKEAVPGATRMAVLTNPDFPATPNMVAETSRAAKALAVDLKVLEARRPAQIAPAFGAMTRAQTNALVVLPDPMFIAEAPRIAELAKTSRLPAMFHLRRFVEMGGLISYGAEYTDMFQQSAVLVAKVLGGSKAGDLPVEQPWQFALVINAKTATALGLTIPPSLLGQANQVIE